MKSRYNVFDTTGTDHWQLLEGVADDAIEIAHAVSVQTVSELTGLTVSWIEDHAAGAGEVDVTCVSLDGECQEFLVRRTDDGS